MALGTMTAEEAAREIATHQKRMNAGRRVPKLPTMLQEISARETVHIYNVGPWELTRELGSAGIWTIPACPLGTAFTRLRPIPGVVTEPTIIDEANMELKLEEGGGRYLAEQVIGVGRFIPKSASFEPMGAFIGAAVGPFAMPTEEELNKARLTLANYFMTLINEARRAWDRSPKEAEEIISDKHHMAADRLYLNDEPWKQRRVTGVRQACPACGTTSNENVVVCPTCKFILNQEKFEALKNQFVK